MILPNRIVIREDLVLSPLTGTSDLPTISFHTHNATTEDTLFKN